MKSVRPASRWSRCSRPETTTARRATCPTTSLGQQIARVDRAIRSLGEIGNVHICRYGDGSEHLHWWFMARPARFEQLRSNLVAIWDDVLPPVPEEVWRADVEVFRAALAE
jgi:hypothetical protein